MLNYLSKLIRRYELSEYYGKLAEKGGAEVVKISDEFTLAQTTEAELLYLQMPRKAYRKMRFEPYLKKLYKTEK